MTSDRECYVYIVLPGTTEFVTAGRFRVSGTRDGLPRGEFVYGQSYLGRGDAVEFDPVELRLASQLYETGLMDGFFGAIRDAMPDHWGRLLIEKHAGRAGLEEFDYLLKGPDDRAGALGFGPEIQPATVRIQFSRFLDLDRLQAAADAVTTGSSGETGPDAAQVKDLLFAGTSMGGARPKTVVQDHHSLWIAKFSRHEDRWNHPRTEHALLRLASECGINTVTSRVERVAGRDVLLVRRFDRDWGGNGYHRHRMVSALTLLQTDDSQPGRSRWSYLLLADEIRRVSKAPTEDLRQLFTRMCFNAAVSNLDDHPRNHAVLAKEGGWRLSPAYDLTPTPSVAVENRDLAMACGPAGRSARKANLLDGAGRFLLDREDATRIFERVTATVRTSWHATMREAGLNEVDCEAIRSAFVYDGLFYEMNEGQA